MADLEAVEEEARHAEHRAQVVVLPVDAQRCRLMLCDRVDQRIACLGMLDEESAHARGERAEEAGWQRHDPDRR